MLCKNEATGAKLNIYKFPILCINAIYVYIDLFHYVIYFEYFRLVHQLHDSARMPGNTVPSNIRGSIYSHNWRAFSYVA